MGKVDDNQRCFRGRPHILDFSLEIQMFVGLNFQWSGFILTPIVQGYILFMPKNPVFFIKSPFLYNIAEITFLSLLQSTPVSLKKDFQEKFKRFSLGSAPRARTKLPQNKAPVRARAARTLTKKQVKVQPVAE